MFLTLVFRESGVAIPEGETAIRLRHTDYYNERSLQRMGCEKKEGRWIRKGGEQRPAEQGEPIVRDDPIPGSPPASPTHSAAEPAVSPAQTHVPPPPAQPAPPESHVDEDHEIRLARRVAEETAVRVQTAMESVMERMEHRLMTSIRLQGERIAEIQSELQRFTSRQDQHFRGPPAQPDTSSSQPDQPAAAAPVPERPQSSAAPTVSALPPRPPRPTIMRSGPASRTRSRTPARSGDSPPSVHLPDTRSLRVYTRSGHRRVTGPIDIPSE